jgi:8-oxo-dGTP diphosphatase
MTALDDRNMLLKVIMTISDVECRANRKTLYPSALDPIRTAGTAAMCCGHARWPYAPVVLCDETGGYREEDLVPIGNVSERRRQPPDAGISVVILALAPQGTEGNARASHADQELSDIGETGRLWIPLVKRVKQPFLDDWALPGGGLQCGISLEQAAFSALASTTDMHPRYLEQLYTFGDPDRSSGGLPMVSIVYWALVGEMETKQYPDADNVQWFPVDALPDMAFDHRNIIEYAVWRLRNKIEYSTIAARLVGERFTLAQLRSVHEAVLGHCLDPANFRRRMLASGELEDTGSTVVHGRSRPAAVYRYRASERAAFRFGTASQKEKPLAGISLPDDDASAVSAQGQSRSKA